MPLTSAEGQPPSAHNQLKGVNQQQPGSHERPESAVAQVPESPKSPKCVDQQLNIGPQLQKGTARKLTGSANQKVPSALELTESPKQELPAAKQLPDAKELPKNEIQQLPAAHAHEAATSTLEALMSAAMISPGIDSSSCKEQPDVHSPALPRDAPTSGAAVKKVMRATARQGQAAIFRLKKDTVAVRAWRSLAKMRGVQMHRYPWQSPQIKMHPAW